MTERTPGEFEWLDGETKDAIHWHAFWDAFAPVTPYGRVAKQQMKPLLPGFEGDAELAWQILREDQRHFAEADISTIREHLAGLPDIHDTLSTLTWSTAPLTPKHFLALKQFAVRGLHLAMLPAVAKDGWRFWSHPGDFAPLVGVFLRSPDAAVTATEQPGSHSGSGSGAGHTPAEPGRATEQGLATEQGRATEQGLATEQGQVAEHAAASAAAEQFSVEDLGSKAYATAQQAVAAAMQRVAAAKRQQHQLWSAATGSKLRRDGQLVIPLPNQRDLAEACKQDSRLKWLRDTPYESIFELLPDDDLCDAQFSLERAKDSLAAEEQRLLVWLTDRIRDTLNAWEQALTAVTELDVRTAKVRMLRLIHGCVPDFGTGVEMTDGAHPETALRLMQMGQTFTPVTLRPGDGVNLLVGSNMGGKTMSLSVLVASQILAQYGLPVPAQSFRTRLFAAIRFAATSGTDVHSGLSAYGAEVVRVSACWEALGKQPPALVVFDEPVRSTNPIEGAALVTGLVRAVREQIAGTQSVVFFATHYADPLREPAVTKFRVRGLKQDVSDGLTRLAPSSETDAHHEQGEYGARGDQDSRVNDTPQAANVVQRLMRLEAAMDYRIERVTTLAIDQEALPVAEFLGAPGEWLKYARQYLREESKP
ncbi:hypothetical protein JZ785_19360 [Alicyclobacillus curvatus]|nr:hypothetical protein JZ785_19360 [Alicyclobacillus curvatus]